MFNYPGAPGQFSRPPGYAGSPPGMGGMGPPLGMGPPPNAGPAPGVTPPPGMNQAQNALPGRPGGLPPNWPPPTNMPNINFNAPVIRLGTTGPPRGAALDGPGGRRESAAPSRRGLGMDMDMRNPEMDREKGNKQLLPPTREEVFRTIFVSNITEGVGGDAGLENILRTAGNLRRWQRATDAENKPCTFGFAEYEDAQGLETAAEIFKNGIEVPTKRQEPGKIKKEEEDDKIETSTVLIIVDEASKNYAQEWKERRNEDEDAVQFRIDQAKSDLEGVLRSLFHPQKALQMDHVGDLTMRDGQMQQDSDQAEIVTIPLSAEDELSDIPAEMRETVAAEIAAFRDRSNQRDRERLRREEEIEAEDRRRNGRTNRLASPPPTAPSGPAGGANGVPLGPRGERGVQGAPSGPKGFGSQIPRDYQNGVGFVNGGVINNGTATCIRREDEDDSASDSEIERRYQNKKNAELEKSFHDQERRWIIREKNRARAIEAQEATAKEKEEEIKRRGEELAKWLEEFDDDVEAERRTEEYYRDRGAWSRNRNHFRKQEEREDALDRQAEEREKAHEFEMETDSFDRAESFPGRQAEDFRPLVAQEPKAFKMSLGAAAKKVEKAAAPRRTAAEVEDLLGGEEGAEDAATSKRTLIPLKFDDSIRYNLDDEERKLAQDALLQDISKLDRESLFKYEIPWDSLTEEIERDLRKWTEGKIVEFLGVQEDMLVDVVMDHLGNKGKPEDLIEELEGALDDAPLLVKKLWGVVAYTTEIEKRGIR